MGHKPLDNLGELQRTVLETVWELGEASVHEVRERLNRTKRLAYTTVLSAMQKLERLGWLKHRAEGRTYVYQPVQSREEEGTRSVKEFTKRIFKGDPLLLFQRLLDDEELKKEDLVALEKMIKQKKREKNND